MAVAVAAVSGERFGFFGAGDTEVKNFGGALRVDQDVAGLEVAVDDALLMGVVNGGANPDHEVDTVAERDATEAAVIGQRGTVHELHGDEREAATAEIDGTGLKDLRDARVLKTAENLGFVLEPLARAIGSKGGADELQSHGARGAVLLGEVDHSHAARAEKLADGVGTNPHAGGDRFDVEDTRDRAG